MAEDAYISSRIYRNLRPLYFVCKICGLLPWYLQEDCIKRDRVSVHRIFNIAYCMLWVIVFILGLSVRILNQSYQNRSKLALKIQIFYKMHFISQYITSIVCSFHLVIISNMKFIRLLEKLSQVDYKIFSPDEEQRVNRKTSIIVISELVIILLLILSYETYNSSVHPNWDVIILISVITNIAAFITNTLTILLFTSFVVMVTRRHGHLNKLLQNVFRGRNHVNRLGYCGHVQRVSKCNATVPHVHSTGVKRINYVSTSQEIRSIRILYNELYDMVSVINFQYGFPILVMACWVLIELVLTVYSFLCCFTINTLKVAFYYIIFFFLFVKMATVCQFAENERQTSINLVHKLLLEDNIDEIDCKELGLLASQLRDMKIKYTACGFFTLNLPYLCSVTSLTVSYIIIMIQLQ